MEYYPDVSLSPTIDIHQDWTKPAQGLLANFTPYRFIQMVAKSTNTCPQPVFLVGQLQAFYSRFML